MLLNWCEDIDMQQFGKGKGIIFVGSILVMQQLPVKTNHSHLHHRL